MENELKQTIVRTLRTRGRFDLLKLFRLQRIGLKRSSARATEGKNETAKSGETAKQQTSSRRKKTTREPSGNQIVVPSKRNHCGMIAELQSSIPHSLPQRTASSDRRTKLRTCSLSLTARHASVLLVVVFFLFVIASSTGPLLLRGARRSVVLSPYCRFALARLRFRGSRSIVLALNVVLRDSVRMGDIRLRGFRAPWT